MAAAAGVSAEVLRVLVVEDDDAVAEGLRMLLEQEYRVDVAPGGQRALELLLDDGPFDAVLCDLMMPGMSGIDLFYAVAEAAPGLEKRLVFMTGGAFTTEAEAFLERIANPRVEKPFDFASVDQLLRRAARSSAQDCPARADGSLRSAGGRLSAARHRGAAPQDGVGTGVARLTRAAGRVSVALRAPQRWPAAHVLFGRQRCAPAPRAASTA
jgi:DNA-binding NtrC family response regulator